MPSEIQCLTLFQNNIITFFDQLIDQFPHEGNLIAMRIFFKDRIEIDHVMKVFCEKITENDGELAKMGKARNENFFLEHNIFDYFGKDRANHMKNIWQSGDLDDDSKNAIWDWIAVFIRIANAYMDVSPMTFPCGLYPHDNPERNNDLKGI